MDYAFSDGLCRMIELGVLGLELATCLFSGWTLSGWTMSPCWHLFGSGCFMEVTIEDAFAFTLPSREGFCRLNL